MDNYLGQVNQTASYAGQIVVPTLRERATQQLDRAKRHVADLELTLKLLDENPTLEQFHNAVTKAGI